MLAINLLREFLNHRIPRSIEYDKEKERSTIQHILSGCIIPLNQGRYTWRHNKVLIMIAEHITYHVDNRVSKRGKPTNRVAPIEFVRAGQKYHGKVKKIYRFDAGILRGADGQLRTVL